MFKKIMIVALVIMTLFTALVPAMAENTNVKAYASPKTMYVKTANGGPLNIRTAPDAKANNVIGQYKYGTAVTVIGTAAASNDWVAIKYGTRTAFVMVKFLNAQKPTAAETAQAEITHQMNHYQAVKTSFTIVARPDNKQTGWVNFRSQPGTGAPRLTTLKDGQTLTVIGETPEWYKAIDSVTGQTGFVSKAYVKKLS